MILLAEYAIGAVGALTTARRLKGVRFFLILAAVHFCFLTFFDATKHGSCLVYIIPLLVVLLAVWISAFWKTSPPSARPILAAGVAGVCSFAAWRHGPHDSSQP